MKNEQVTVNESGYTTASELSFSYDEKHRLEQMSIQDNTGAKWALARYQYNGDNQPTYVNQLRLTYKKNSGQLESKEINKIKIVYSYDNQYGDLSKIDYQLSGKSIYVQEFKRNLIGQISEVNRGEAIQLHYDKVGRYIGKTKKNSPIDLASHIYDKNGNRVKGEEDGQSYVASYDVQDRLISYNGSTYSYGASGELQSVVSPSLELTTYSYNTDGRLIGVSRAGKQVSYKLDGEGRRIEKRVNGESSRYYVWDGSLRLVGEMNSVGELLSRYIYVGDEHSPTMMEKGSERYIFIKDERGSIEKVVNIKSGEVVEEISYGDWGNIKSDSNAEFQPFRYAGGLYDSDTGLIRFGARDYDPTIGRWTSKDPIGFGGGDTNLYNYVANNPINDTDMSGLASDCTRPLNFLPGQAGYVSHEFVCYTGKDGKVKCGGLGPTGNPLSSPGQIEPDQPNGTCKDAGKGCMDDCVANQLQNNVPQYRLVGSNCHDYAQTVMNTCKAVCGGK